MLARVARRCVSGRDLSSRFRPLLPPCRLRQLRTHDWLTAMDVGVQAQAPLTQLPHTLLHAILLRLPSDERSRVATVCRTLHDVVANPVLWTEVDLTRESVACSLINPSRIVLALAPRLAATRVLRLQASPETREQATVVLEMLRAVLRVKREGFAPCLRELAVAGALQTSVTSEEYEAERLQVCRALLTEAPKLTRLEVTEPWSNSAPASALLTLPGLRIHTLRWLSGRLTDTAPLMIDALAALVRHDGLQELSIPGSTTHLLELSSLMPRVMDVALARRLTALNVSGVRDAPSLVPLMVRLLRESTTLRSLYLGQGMLFETHSATPFAAALRANTTLQELELRDVGMWVDGSEDAGVAVCAALEGHPSITRVSFAEMRGNGRLHPRALDASLDALLRANAPALMTLNVSLRVAGRNAYLPRMFSALAHNMHLRSLLFTGLARDAAFLRNTVLPGVRGNTSLRELHLRYRGEPDADVRNAITEAELLVKARAELAAL